ncbi:MAG: RecX family transcriptional regulator [Bacteroidia bacterium]|nr:MAG: RecX family transcriptional regulator [Bacteroidia bacterium]
MICRMISPDELREKAARYCAWRERCTMEVRDKLYQMGAGAELTNRILEDLIRGRYIDDQRFADLYVQGKFRNNRWGKVKISAGLKQRQIPDAVISRALATIDETQYKQVLQRLITDKRASLSEQKKKTIPEKTAAYCIQKGFESALVWDILNKQP